MIIIYNCLVTVGSNVAGIPISGRCPSIIRYTESSIRCVTKIAMLLIYNSPS